MDYARIDVEGLMFEAEVSLKDVQKRTALYLVSHEPLKMVRPTIVKCVLVPAVIVTRAVARDSTARKTETQKRPRSGSKPALRLQAMIVELGKNDSSIWTFERRRRAMRV